MVLIASLFVGAVLGAVVVLQVRRRASFEKILQWLLLTCTVLLVFAFAAEVWMQHEIETAFRAGGTEYFAARRMIEGPHRFSQWTTIEALAVGTIVALAGTIRRVRWAALALVVFLLMDLFALFVAVSGVPRVV